MPASSPAFPAPELPAPGLPVVETFHSLQGEGLHAGRSALFIRLAGCTVGCSWCDTKHSWPAAAHASRPLAGLAAEAVTAAAAGAAFVVITGGEPLHHNLNDLCQALRAIEPNSTSGTLPLHLETSGVDPLSGHFDWITLSPKRHKPPTTELLAACDELKVVVNSEADLTFAEAMAQAAKAARSIHPHHACHELVRDPVLLIQPAAGCSRSQELAIAYVMAHSSWRLSLQTHKWLGVR